MLKRRINFENTKFDSNGIISDLANGIAQYYFDLHGHLDPEVIATENNITYSYGDYGNSFDGLIECINNRFHIYINTHGKQPGHRVRFTFCHELGHYFISEHCYALVNGDEPALSTYTGFKTDSYIERQADIFAANLLLPIKYIHSDIISYVKFDFRLIDSISEKYLVSKLAVLYRLLNINYFPFIIVKSKNGKLINYPSRTAGFHYQIKYTLPEKSLANKILTEQKEISGPMEIKANEWFITSDECLMNEWCIFYRRENIVYSILSLK